MEGMSWGRCSGWAVMGCVMELSASRDTCPLSHSTRLGVREARVTRAWSGRDVHRHGQGSEKFPGLTRRKRLSLSPYRLLLGTTACLPHQKSSMLLVCRYAMYASQMWMSSGVVLQVGGPGFWQVHGRGGGAVQSHGSLNPQADPVHLPSSLLVKFLMPLLQEVALDALKGEGNWGIISETQAFRADHRLGCHAFRGL